MTEIKFDDRPIKAIWWADGAEGYSVGRSRVTRIDVCYVAGQMAAVPWFEVYKGDTLAARVNAAHVQDVVYI